MKIDLHKIEGLITPIVEAMGYIVWHIELHQVSHKTLLRIYIDTSTGAKQQSITLDDCGRVSAQIGALFDIENPILESYVLEVSSPGVNRSLFKLEHYARYLGGMVRIVLRQPLEERHDFTGKIQELIGDTLKLEVAGRVVSIEITNISKAKLISDV